jgi:hypothetical protein
MKRFVSKKILLIPNSREASAHIRPVLTVPQFAPQPAQLKDPIDPSRSPWAVLSVLLLGPIDEVGIAAARIQDPARSCRFFPGERRHGIAAAAACDRRLRTAYDIARDWEPG